MDGRDRLTIILRSPTKLPIAAADRPGPQTDPREFQVGISEAFGLHESVGATEPRAHLLGENR